MSKPMAPTGSLAPTLLLREELQALLLPAYCANILVGVPEKRTPVLSVRSRDISEMNPKVVLVVEDEPALASIYKQALELRGYQVLLALNAEQALEIAGEQEGGIDLLLSDIVMDGMGGRELVWRLRDSYAELPVILASGYANEDGALQMMEELNVLFVPKPIDLDRLLDAVRESIG